jgi:glycosyltransferase involved in cell wall biosynthesis
MAQIYSCADLLVLPSVQDNFPNTALESLACGLPVVGFDVGGVPEIVRNDCTGMVVPAGNAQAFASAISDLLADAGRRDAMSRKCRRVAMKEYSLQVQAKRYLDLYSSLAANGSN